MASAQDITKAHRMSYRIGRGEQGVLSFEPYKSEILPLWRFKTPDIARQSSKQILEKFNEYEQRDDFVGMDMCRKFLQMGMTRAKRYASHTGGRKYDKQTGAQLPKTTQHKGAQDKLAASLIFKEVWELAKTQESYLSKKEKFLAEQREWDRGRRQAKTEIRKR